jgi:hypothetical protein
VIKKSKYSGRDFQLDLPNLTSLESKFIYIKSRGGCGIVWLGYKEKTGEKFAVK